MSKRKEREEDGGSVIRKQEPNFKTEEIKFLLSNIKNAKGTLFGPLGPTLTFSKKIEAWITIMDNMVAAGYPKRTKKQLKKKWEDQSSNTKLKYQTKMKTGGGAVEWNAVDDLVQNILGKDNPTLTSISGGIDSGDQVSEESMHMPSTSKDHVGVLSEEKESEVQMITPKRKAKETRLSLQPNLKTATTNELASLYEQQMTEEHEMKLRILQKKEILVDLQIALAREELDQMRE